MFLEFIYTIIEFKKNIAMQKKALEERKALNEERINPKYLDKKLYIEIMKETLDEYEKID